MYLALTATLLFVVGALLYLTLTSLIQAELSESLLHQVDRISAKMEQGQDVATSAPELEIEAGVSLVLTEPQFQNVMILDEITNELEPYREVVVINIIAGVSYRITARQIRIEASEYLGSIGIALLLAMVVLLAGLYYLNQRVSQSIWRPFYDNLDALKSFSLQNERGIELQDSGISEFTELNRSIMELSNRVRSDFKLLKSFTENASHEIQTPLSIIQVKLEEALQLPDLPEHHAQLLNEAFSSTQRLSRLNRSLLFLTKIENQQFDLSPLVVIPAILERVFEQYEDVMLAKGLSVDVVSTSPLSLRGNVFLIESLLSNLIGNAIKHNREGGLIQISWSDADITIANSGVPLSVDPMSLVERFAKADQTSPSLGLGLAISKSICEVHNWDMKYTTENDVHSIRIGFRL